MLLQYISSWHTYFAAGIAAMTYGDAFAAIVGRRYGRHRYYQPLGGESNVYTLEGSLANFVFTFVGVGITWWVMSPPGITSTGKLLYGALISAVVATPLEALSPWGSDNLIVPIGVSWVLELLNF
jgi:phytol kinase